MSIFYDSFLDTLDPKSINKVCKKCTDNGLCELTNGSMSIGAIGKFCDCEYLQELF
jgi:hypothetical protein